ncbi:amino acid ABC transporter ATP-binding protein [Brachyspira alvinipulli]|uniref:amino acid ABC transporter ATP-binding protein n=1 Tax=Brachyspira alvinipulli TaxID=84379 RepID=UPI002637A850|nr:amino acid ABC transporter ATP-binding protein [uncultured Brachyspira sp.]
MIEVKDLKKSFGTLDILKGISFKIQYGEVLTLIGPSGTGKSTLLRCINFLEKPNNGIITIGDLTLDTQKATRNEIYALRKKTSMVFQNYNLFKNKTALENIMEPMVTVQKMDIKKAKEEALHIIETVGLFNKKDEYPSRLSGGQQQRVGIGRAMAVHPDVILLDEPTSSLDPELVGEVLNVIKDLAQKHTTMLITTHEMQFAKNVSNKVIFMADGYIVEEGTPNDIFNNPQNERLKTFLRKINER